MLRGDAVAHRAVVGLDAHEVDVESFRDEVKIEAGRLERRPDFVASGSALAFQQTQCIRIALITSRRAAGVRV